MRLDVSVIVPVLNEPALPQVIRAISGELRRAALQHEIVVVSDGDEEHEPAPGVRLVTGRRRGKGAAVRDGLLAATGDVAVVIDADLAALARFVPEFVRLVKTEGFGVVIAEREKDFHGRHPLRFVLSYGLYLAQRLLVFHSRRFTDTQCGLKAFRREVAHELARKQRVEGGMYDIEYLYLAAKQRMKIAQIPVGRVVETRSSRIRLLRCLRQDPVALLGVKLRGLLGRYR